MRVGAIPDAAVPFLDGPGSAAILEECRETWCPGRHELRPMVERGSADPPARQAAANASALVEHQHPAAGPLEIASGGQPRQSGADDERVGHLSRLLRHLEDRTS